MKINRSNIILISACIILAAVLSVVTVACSSASSQTTQTVTSATTSTINAVSTSSTTTQSSQFQRQGANGTLASINGNTLTLTTPQGQATVIIISSTTIDKTVVGAVSDLAQGEMVTISGTTDSTGNVSATSIMVLPQGQPVQPFPSNGTTPGNGGTFTRPNGGSSAGGTGRQFTIGTISGINGDSLTVTTTLGDVTVNIGSDTVIEKTVSGILSNLQVGVFLTVVGPTDSNGDIDANSISIRPQGQGFPNTTSTTTQNQTYSNTPNSATSTASTSTYHIGIYSDANCTKPISSLDWGDLPQGTSVTQTIYVENEDNQTMSVTASISIGATSGITFTNSGPLNMIPGSLGPSVYQLQMSLSASSVATLGDLNFSISFTGAVPVSITSHVSIVSPLAASTSTTTSP